MAKQDAKCAFCDSPATRLCDFILGFEIAGWTKCGGQAALNANRFEEFVPGKGLPYTSSGSQCFTCDAPICSACSRHHGNTFFDGDKKHTMVDTIDTCPIHVTLGAKAPVISAETADKIRMQLWQRRAGFKIMG